MTPERAQELWEEAWRVDRGGLDEWPKCAVPPCQNKCCLRLHSKYCWPHTPGVLPGEVAESLAAERYEGGCYAEDEAERWQI